jgi:TetR/AcrR family transcriptional regulator, regulator of biofilm formation and stress response
MPVTRSSKRETDPARPRAAARSRPAVRPRAAVRPRGAARREALLEATLRIVADVGADAVTHRRVAEVAGLPLASTTYYFGSKEELLTAALELAAQRDLERLREIAEDRRRLPASPDDAVAAAMGPSGQLPHDPAAGRRSLLASYTLLLEAARRPALQALTRRWTEAYLTTISELLQRAGSASPDEHAQLLLAAADGMLIAQLSTGELQDPRPQLQRLARTLTGTLP